MKPTTFRYIFALLNIATLFIAFIYFILLQTISVNTPLLGWDEVNYVRASELGISSNAFEKGSLNLIQFLNLGYSKLKKQPLIISHYPLEYNDPFNLRHFHPPLPVYFWSLFLNKQNLLQQNKLLRLSNLFLGFILIFIFIGMIYLVQPNKDIWSTIEILPLISIFVISKIFNYSFSSLNFHTFFLINSILFVGFLIRFINKPTQINSIFIGIAGALLIATLETWIVILTASVLSILILSYKRIFTFKVISTFYVSLFITLVIIWPGIIKTVGPLKEWLMYAYRIFIVQKEYSHVFAYTKWFDIIKSNYELFILFIFTLVVALIHIRKLTIDKTIIIPFIIGICYAIFMTPFILNDTYIFPAIGIMLFGMIIILQRLFSDHKIFYSLFILPTIIAVIIITATTNFQILQKQSDTELNNFNIALTQVKNIATLENEKPLLVDGGFIFRYYLNIDRNIIEDLDTFNPNNPQFYRRIDYMYENQLPLIKNRYYGAIIFQTNRPYSEYQMKQLESWGYNKKHIGNYYIFYLK